MDNKEYLNINSVQAYYDICNLGSPKHPMLGIYSFEDLPKVEVRDDVNLALGLYTITIKYDCNCKLLYGQTGYDFDEGVMGFTAPNQMLVLSKNFQTPRKGWCLIFHPDFILGYELFSKIQNYNFFDYSVNEALILSKDEEQDIEELFRKIKQEESRPIDNFSQDVLIAQIDLLLTLSNRFYNRQFITRKPLNNHLFLRFRKLLDDYYCKQQLHSLPSVHYFADQLCISSKYLSDVLKNLTGQTTQQHIHSKVLKIAKEKLVSSNLSVSEVAYQLGFEYPQSFSKFFKSKTQLSPVDFKKCFN